MPLVDSRLSFVPAARLRSDFICFIYPAYRTFKTLEGKFLGHQFDGVVEDQSIEVHRYWSE